MKCGQLKSKLPFAPFGKVCFLNHHHQSYDLHVVTIGLNIFQQAIAKSSKLNLQRVSTWFLEFKLFIITIKTFKTESFAFSCYWVILSSRRCHLEVVHNNVNHVVLLFSNLIAYIGGVPIHHLVLSFSNLITDVGVLH